MADSIQFTSSDSDSVIGLTKSITWNDDRFVELPETFCPDIRTFAENQEDSNEMITIIEADEYTDIYIVDFCEDPHNHSVIIAFDDDMRHVYLATGISATEYLIELNYKRPDGRIIYKTTGRLYQHVYGVINYIDADIEYPETGKVSTRVEKDLE